MIRFGCQVLAGFLVSLLPASALVMLRACLLEPGLQGRWLLCARQAISMAVVAAIVYLLLAFTPKKAPAAATVLLTAVLVGGCAFVIQATRPTQEKWGAIQALEQELATQVGQRWVPPTAKARVERFSPTSWHLSPRNSFLAIVLGDDPFQLDDVVVEVDEQGLVLRVHVDYF